MNENRILPEISYSIDDNMSMEKIYQAMRNQTFLVGKVIQWNACKRALEVALGNNIFGYIPEAEISLYKTFKPDGFPSAELYKLIGKTVCVKVVPIISDDIILSRKRNMVEGFNNLKEGDILTGYIKSDMKSAFFLDVGFGVSGMLYVSDFSRSFINNICDVGVVPNNFLKIIIKEIDYDFMRVTLGHKELFENLTLSLNEGDLVSCTVLNHLTAKASEGNGYFVHVNPNTTGIVNSDVPLLYGDKIIGRVKKVTDLGLKLNFIRYS